jgi:hypothetical protein
MYQSQPRTWRESRYSGLYQGILRTVRTLLLCVEKSAAIKCCMVLDAGFATGLTCPGPERRNIARANYHECRQGPRRILKGLAHNLVAEARGVARPKSMSSPDRGTRRLSGTTHVMPCILVTETLLPQCGVHGTNCP